MGAEQSTLDGKGYHVLRIQESSPAHHADLQPFFDYIVGINGEKLVCNSKVSVGDFLINRTSIPKHSLV